MLQIGRSHGSCAGPEEGRLISCFCLLSRDAKCHSLTRCRIGKLYVAGLRGSTSLANGTHRLGDAMLARAQLRITYSQAANEWLVYSERIEGYRRALQPWHLVWDNKIRKRGEAGFRGSGSAGQTRMRKLEENKPIRAEDSFDTAVEAIHSLHFALTKICTGR